MVVKCCHMKKDEFASQRLRKRQILMQHKRMTNIILKDVSEGQLKVTCYSLHLLLMLISLQIMFFFQTVHIFVVTVIPLMEIKR